jgi:hypothetical protein
MFYSASTPGFYSREIHGDNMPDDAVEITDELYAELFEGQSAGKHIVADKKGRPILVDPPPPSAETLALIERAWRDAELTATDGIVARHRDEIEVKASTTLTAKQYVQLQGYRQALRSWTEAEAFPAKESRPEAPEWLNT